MKKAILASAIFLLAAGCTEPAIKTVSQAMDDAQSNAGAPQQCKPDQPESGIVLYRNSDLGFEFEPGKFVFVSIDRPDSATLKLNFKGQDGETGAIVSRPWQKDFQNLGYRLQDDVHNLDIKDLGTKEYNCKKFYTFEDGYGRGEKSAETTDGKRVFIISGGLLRPEILGSFNFVESK